MTEEEYQKAQDSLQENMVELESLKAEFKQVFG
jgi:hypothetical protein